jgi:hypothetical protein
MSDRRFIRALIALKFIGMVTVGLIYTGGPWTVVVIVTTGVVVFGLVGLASEER